MADRMIVAIDGPSGVGKSTVSRQIARQFGLAHLDTGAFYRAATLAVLEAGVDTRDAARVIEVVGGAAIEQADGLTTLGGVDVTQVIRSDAVTAAVSAVSAIPEVRDRMVELQRQWVGRHDGRAVVEGRDIGSVVFPDADLKLFLTADAEERARRRAGQVGRSDAERIREEQERRDSFDSSRAVSPLAVADGALLIDTTDLTLHEVVDLVVAELATRLG